MTDMKALTTAYQKAHDVLCSVEQRVAALTTRNHELQERLGAAQAEVTAAREGLDQALDSALDADADDSDRDVMEDPELLEARQRLAVAKQEASDFREQVEAIARVLETTKTKVGPALEEARLAHLHYWRGLATHELGQAREALGPLLRALRADSIARSAQSLSVPFNVQLDTVAKELGLTERAMESADLGTTLPSRRPSSVHAPAR